MHAKELSPHPQSAHPSVACHAQAPNACPAVYGQPRRSGGTRHHQVQRRVSFQGSGHRDNRASHCRQRSLSQHSKEPLYAALALHYSHRTTIAAGRHTTTATMQFAQHDKACRQLSSQTAIVQMT